VAVAATRGSLIPPASLPGCPASSMWGRAAAASASGGTRSTTGQVVLMVALSTAANCR